MRTDRLIPLRLLHDAPDIECLDMTFCYPKGHGGAIHLFLLTQALSPVVLIDDQRFYVRSASEADLGALRWLDLGSVDAFDTATPFGQLYVTGMSLAQAQTSWLLLTTQPDFYPTGSLEQTERALFGLTTRELGRTTLSPCIVKVCEPTLFVCTYEAGTGLPPGARLRFSVPLSFAWPQTEQPDGDGFIQWQCERRAIFLGGEHPNGESHEKVYYRFELPEGLEAGERLVLTYFTQHTHMVPQVQAVEPLLYWYSRVPVFYAEVALDAREQYLGLPPEQSHQAEFVAREASRLLLTLPGVRKTGEEIAIQGRFVDEFRNYPPTGIAPAGIKLMLVQGDARLPLGAPEHWKGLYAFEQPLPTLAPGVWRVEAYGQGALLARSNPLLIDPDATDALYWGEIHCHSEMSDGIGKYEALYEHARDAACLDFASGCDHACYFSDNQWQWMQALTNTFNEDGRFTTLIGYEWAGQQVHRNLYTSRGQLKLYRGMYGPTSDLKVVYDALRDDDQIVSGCHAPMAHGIDWSRFDPEIERYIEVYSMWGRSDQRETYLAPVRVHDKCASAYELMNASGARLGFTGGGDCHEAMCGLTCRDDLAQGQRSHHIYRNLKYASGLTALRATECNRQEVLHSLRHRKTYATTGMRTLLFVEMDGIPMGGEGTAVAHRLIGRVHACEALIKARILRDGEPVAERELSGLDATFAWQDETRPAGTHAYSVQIFEAHDNMTLATPIWVDYSPAAQ